MRFGLWGFLVLLLVGCTNNYETDMGSDKASTVLSFKASLSSIVSPTGSNGSSSRSGLNYSMQVDDWALHASRGVPTTYFDDDAGLFGFLYSGEWVSSNTVWSLMNNSAYEFDGDELTSKGTPIYWSSSESVGKDSLRVYAYSPKSLGDTPPGGVSPLGYDATGVPTLSYTVPSTVSSQQDIIVADTIVSSAFRSGIPLTFTHALTAIQFKLGFSCSKVKSVSVTGVHNKGVYSLGGEWSSSGSGGSYTISFGTDGTSFNQGDLIATGANTLMMIPQELPEGAKVVLVYNNGGSDITISVDISEMVWERGKMITYTLYEKSTTSYIYFDLAAGSVNITPSGYTGYIYVGGSSTPQVVQGAHVSTNMYYVYQSSESQTSTNHLNTGWPGAIGSGTCRVPVYSEVMYNGMRWSDYITNNSVVEDVILGWSAAVKAVHRDSTLNVINVSGTLDCNLTIDNIFSKFQTKSNSRSTGGIAYIPTVGASTPSSLVLTIVGDNRLGNLHYSNPTNNGSKIVFEGEGSLTVADVDYNTKTDGNKGGEGFYSNHWASVIGADDATATQNAYGIYINSGVIYAGSTAAENCTAIGGGGNGHTTIRISGGVITAVATTTGTAIGGGIGFQGTGGIGDIEISGGNVYAYNFANTWDIPSAAIGGAGSNLGAGSKGYVKISGGNVYALSAIGTAIGGGSSKTNSGGDAEVVISGGTVIAKSISAIGGAKGGNVGAEIPAGAGIGGGTGGVNDGVNGGTAKITITGNPIIRTGSIGGGLTNSATGMLGSAEIVIEGGDIQAQFVMSKGAAIKPSFKMYDGLIRNSNTDDVEYAHIRDNGGAVYMEYGDCEILGGRINNCSGEKGGAIYINGDASTTFTMSSGYITNCDSDIDGGALCLEGGIVKISGGEITDNLCRAGNGGGVCVRDGSFSMTGDAVLSRNSAMYGSENEDSGNGGGLYISSSNSSVSVNVATGEIAGNSADRNGGGICVDMEGNSNVADVKVGTYVSGVVNETNPDISGNRALLAGGGMYVIGANADVDINSGRIIDNSVSAYVDNADVANELGMVLLQGGNVTHKVVTFHGNGGLYTEDGTDKTSAIQNIVTATNSTLVPPIRFVRVGYRQTGWNTRADGNGDSYSDGQIMNISADIELYAVWEIIL